MTIYYSHLEGFGIDRKYRLTNTDIEKLRMLGELIEHCSNTGGRHNKMVNGSSQVKVLKNVSYNNFSKLASQLERRLRLLDIQ